MNRWFLFGLGLIFAISHLAGLAVVVLLVVSLIWWPNMLWQAGQQNTALRGENEELKENIQELETELVEVRKHNDQLGIQVEESLPFVQAYQEVCEENQNLLQQIEFLSQQLAEQEVDQELVGEIRQLLGVEVE